MIDWEQKYKELWCAVWCCPLDEFVEDSHDDAMAEISEQTLRVSQYSNLDHLGMKVIEKEQPSRTIFVNGDGIGRLKELSNQALASGQKGRG